MTRAGRGDALRVGSRPSGSAATKLPLHEDLDDVAPMSSRGREGGGVTVVVGGQVVEDNAGEASFEAAEDLGLGLTLGELPLVVGPSE